jgi:integrase
MTSVNVQLQRLNSVPLAVIRRQARASDLARLVPECCGLVWNAVRAQQTKAKQLKSALSHRAAKTVNNVLTVLSVMLKTAVEWDAISRVPCAIRLLPTMKSAASFYDFDEYERLVNAARHDPRAYLITLLGGEGGLRCGEMMALEWSDVDLTKRQLRVARSEWKGHVTVPKGGRLRYVPLTKRLTEALCQARHLRGARVLCDEGGHSLTQKVIQVIVRRAARRSNVKPGVHILRHTFCSHLAMRDAPARAIQELAGHQDLETTQRYMPLSPAALDAAIRLLDGPSVAGHGDSNRGRGEIVEAAGNQA